jgi:hypothetical protein
MTTPHVKAEGFLWLILGIFWVVAQIASSAKKKQPVAPPEGVPPAPARSLTELLRRMAEETTTQQKEVRPEPWLPPDTYEEAPQPPQAPLPQFVPEPVVLRTIQEPAPPVLIAPGAHPKLTDFRNSVPSIRLPVMSLSFNSAIDRQTSAKNAPARALLRGGGKETLRRAVLCQLILDRPKGDPARTSY